MNRILLLEDDTSLIDGLQYALEKNGFSPDIATTTAQAREFLSSDTAYALLLLDVTLPDGTGFDICTRVRQKDSRIPIIFLTASDEEVNIIRGLDSGGDDYITKPFKLGELLSRIRALLRRASLSPQDETSLLRCGDLSIDFIQSRASLKNEVLDLTAAEYRLLSLLVRNANQVVPRSRILDELWDSGGSFVDDNTLSVYIRRLREKVETDPSHPVHLSTVRGFGYQWNEVKS
ncbi:response regulator transcription factor [Candidatus Merdisoma sp. JLR.KK006]|uniref:response regulator transcription factor n=1 Tax=Candidatus Merdisoma sp. JLR.KK006 TaxID=3112626 RepID=UPI002FF1B632